MPSIVLPIETEGALVEVEVGWAKKQCQAARLALQPIPPPVQVRALIDTGAETSCLDSKYAQQLGFSLRGISLANVPALGGMVATSGFGASLRLFHPSGQHPPDLFLPDVLMLELNLAALGYQALLGRDVLTLCRFLYDGPTLRFKLRY